MKLYLTVVFTFMACTSTTNSPKNEHNLLLEAINKGMYGVSECDSSIINLVEMKLTNGTDSAFDFIAYNCATAASIVIDPEEVEVCPLKCSSNYPIVINIGPNQEFSMVLITKTKERQLLDSVRFGLVLFPSKMPIPRHFIDSLFSIKQNRENIIWSEPISLKGANPFEIRNQSDTL